MKKFFLALACLLVFMTGATPQTLPANHSSLAIGSMVIASPHQADRGLSYTEAIARINSPRHQTFLKAMNDIHRATGLKPTNIINGAGMYQHAGENISAITYPAGSQTDAVRAAAAALGYVANQKQVLIMTPHPDGEHAIYYFEIPEGKMQRAFETAERNLTAYTLMPNKANPRKGILLVAENQYSGSLEQATNLIANELGIHYDVLFGTVEFLGDPDDRTKAGTILRREASLHPTLGGKGWQSDYFYRDDGKGGLHGRRTWNRLDLWRAILNSASPQPPRRGRNGNTNSNKEISTIPTKAKQKATPKKR